MSDAYASVTPPVATCPVCGKVEPGMLARDAALYAPDDEFRWLAPRGWEWSCGEVGWTCSQWCSNIGGVFGLMVGNHRPDDDYLLQRRTTDPSRPELSVAELCNRPRVWKGEH